MNVIQDIKDVKNSSSISLGALDRLAGNAPYTPSTTLMRSLSTLNEHYEWSMIIMKST